MASGSHLDLCPYLLNNETEILTNPYRPCSDCTYHIDIAYYAHCRFHPCFWALYDPNEVSHLVDQSCNKGSHTYVPGSPSPAHDPAVLP